MLRLGANRKILRIHLQCRLFLAGAHAARARHPRRLRPAQERDRKTLRARAHGAARDGDDGLSMMARQRTSPVSNEFDGRDPPESYSKPSTPYVKFGAPPVH